MACNVRSNVGLCVCLVVRSNNFWFWFLLPKMPNGPMWMVDRTYCRPVMKLYIQLTLHLETDANDGHMPVRPFRYETSSVVVCQPANQLANLPACLLGLHCIASIHPTKQTRNCLAAWACANISLWRNLNVITTKAFCVHSTLLSVIVFFIWSKSQGKNSQQKNRRNPKQSKKNSRPHHAAVWATLFFQRKSLLQWLQMPYAQHNRLHTSIYCHSQCSMRWARTATATTTTRKTVKTDLQPCCFSVSVFSSRKIPHLPHSANRHFIKTPAWVVGWLSDKQTYQPARQTVIEPHVFCFCYFANDYPSDGYKKKIRTAKKNRQRKMWSIARSPHNKRSLSIRGNCGGHYNHNRIK